MRASRLSAVCGASFALFFIASPSFPSICKFTTNNEVYSTYPTLAMPPYLTPVTEPTFQGQVLRIANDFAVSCGTNCAWRPNARHHYSKDLPWSADRGILALLNPLGTPPRLYLDGTTYVPLGYTDHTNPVVHYTDWRWHPLYPNIQIVLDAVADKLFWIDVRYPTDQPIKEWYFGNVLDISATAPADGIGQFEGNTTGDGTFIAITKASTRQVLILNMSTGAMGNVVTLPPANLLNHSGNLGWTSISPDGNYFVAKYASASGAPYNNDIIRVFDVNLGAVELVGDAVSHVAIPHSYSGPDLSCGKDAPLGNPLSPVSGWVHPLKHADMMMDGTLPILVGVNGCTAISGYADQVGRIIRVDLTTGKATRLSKKKTGCTTPPCYNDEAPASHVSCRNYLRPGWAYVTYEYSSQAVGSNTKRFSGEIVAVPLDSSGAYQRFAFTQSEDDSIITPGIPPQPDVKVQCGFDCEPQAVPDPYGNRIVWASNWYRVEGGTGRGAWSQPKAYLLDATCPDGGGGCPFLETWTASGWRVENSILSRSLTGDLGLDAYRLKQAPRVVNGKYRILIRENERELTTIDQVRLAYVDHTPDVRAYAKGAKLLLAKRQLPHKVTTAEGTNVTGLLDGSNDSYFVGEPGQTLTVELMAPGTQAPSTAPGGDGEEIDPFEIDPGEKDGGGGVSSGEIYSISPGEVSSDAVVLGTTGILVQGLDPSGAWTTVRKVYPRKDFAEVLVDTLDQGPVRLVFVGRHKIRYVGRLLPASSELVPSLMDLTSATHTRFGNVRSLLANGGDATSSLAPGDSIVLEYQAPPITAGTVRDLFLLAKGSYSSAPFISEGRPEAPQHFALIQNRPNPFQARTAIRFQIPTGNIVRIDILDAQGRRLQTLANRFFPAGEHSVEWIPRESPSNIGPGVYFYQVRSGIFRDQKQMVLVP